MAPSTLRHVAVTLAIGGVLVVIAGAALALRTVAAVQETARIQHGPRALATVVGTGARSANHEEVTLRFVDDAGVAHEVAALFPLGLASGVDLGESTTVAYDPASPQQAELAAHPRHHWQDALLAAALGLAAAGTALRWAAVLLAQARKLDEEPSIHLGASGAIERTPIRVTAANRHLTGSLAIAAVLLVIGGRLLLQIATFDRPQEVAFPPPPLLPHAAPRALPAALTDTPPATGPLVTPAEANSVAVAAWSYRDHALARHDLESLSAIDADPALAVDSEEMRLGIAPHRADPHPGDVRDLIVFTPRQTRWPLRLLAQAVTTDAGVPALEMLVLTRRSATAHWRVALDTVVTQNAQFTPSVNAPLFGAEGYDVVPRPDWISIRDVVPALGRYWQSIRDTAQPPAGGPPFANGYWTTQYYNATIAGKQDKAGRNGLPAHIDFDTRRADPDEVWTFGLAGDWTLVCSPLRDVETWSGPAHQDRDRQKWGVDLAPGVYGSVTSDIVRETCLFVAARARQPIGVIGGDPYTVDARGSNL